MTMSKVVNLNKVRKLKAREAADKQAAENRVKFGRTKAQKQLDEAETAAAKARLDALKRGHLPDDPT
jgi:capsule polysaccharide export protein KpsE/RkpR